MITKFNNFINESMINESKVVNFDNKYNNFVLLVGSPGAGKSFTYRNLINLDNVKYVNVDAERRMVAKKLGYDITDPEENLKLLDITHTTSDPRNRTIKQLKMILKSYKDKDIKPNIVFDAGGGQIEVMKDVHKLAKESGYNTTMVYVKTDLDIALQRNRERERSLTDKMVVDYYNKVQNAYDLLHDMYDNVFIVTNNEPIDISNRPSDNIEKIK